MGFFSGLFKGVVITGAIAYEAFGDKPRRRRRAQRDRNKLDSKWIKINHDTTTGTCFNCDGRGYMDFQCRACSGSGDKIFPAKQCRSCDGTGTHIFEEKLCFKCDGSGMRHGNKCNKCEGTGIFKPANTVTCRKCKGTGVFSPERTVECNKCNGTGSYHPECRKCGGSGKHKYR